MIQNIIALSLIIAVVIVLRMVFRKKVPARLIYALWIAVVIKLCVPVSLFPILPQINIAEKAPVEDTPVISEETERLSAPEMQEYTYELTEKTDDSTAPESTVPPKVSYEEVGSEEKVPVSHTEADTTPSLSYPNKENEISPIKTEEIPPIKTEETSPAEVAEAPLDTILEAEEKTPIDVRKTLLTVWAVCSAAVALFFIVSATAFSVRLRRTRTYVGKMNYVNVYSSTATETPCVWGLVPTIYITPEVKDSPDCSLALSHEWTHICHGDNIWSIVRILAIVLYPWNPLMWVAAILSKRDSEFACDEAVTAKMGSEERLDYARMLVSVPAKQRGVVGLGSAPLKERVLMLTKKKKTSVIALILAVSLTLSAVGCSFIGPKEEENTPDETDQAETIPEETITVLLNTVTTEKTPHRLNKYVAEYDEYGRIIKSTAYTDGEEFSVTEYTYDEYGYQNSEKYVSDEMSYTYEWTNNTDGNRLKGTEKTEQANGLSSFESEYEYTYDEKGRAVSYDSTTVSKRAMIFGKTTTEQHRSYEYTNEYGSYIMKEWGDDIPETVYHFFFDENGNIDEEIVLTDCYETMRTKYDRHGYAMTVRRKTTSGEEVTRFENTYENGLLTKMIKKSEDGKVLGTTVITYDGNGNPLSSVITGEDGTETSNTVYEYEEFEVKVFGHGNSHAKKEKKESDYAAAVALYESGNYKDARAAFYRLGDYKDSVKYYLSIDARPCKTVYQSDDCTYVTTRSYDENSNLLSEYIDFGSHDVIEEKREYTYDDKGRKLTSNIKNNGSSMTEIYTYTDSGYSMIRDTVGNGNTERYEQYYNNKGLCVKEIYTRGDGSGFFIEYEFDGNGIFLKSYSADLTGNFISSYENEYDESGNVIGIIKNYYGDVQTYSRTYDDHGNITSDKHTFSDGTEEISERRYRYDEFGNIIYEVIRGENGKTVTETVYDNIQSDGMGFRYDKKTVNTSSTSKDGIVLYSGKIVYDSSDRLLSLFSDDGEKQYTEEYTYDVFGNPLEAVTEGKNLETDKTERSSVVYTYDEDGNLIRYNNKNGSTEEYSDFVYFVKEKVEADKEADAQGETSDDTNADKNRDEDGTNETDTEKTDDYYAKNLLGVKIIVEEDCQMKRVEEDDCTLISSELFYNEKNGKTRVYTPEVFIGDYYSFVSVRDSNFNINTVDVKTGKTVRDFTVNSNYALSDCVIAGDKLYWAPDSMNAAGEDCVTLYEFDLLTAAVETVVQIPVSYIKVDISAVDDNDIVFLVNRKDGNTTVPTVYNYDNKDNTLSVVCESRDTDEKICCFDTYGGQIYIITVKDDKGWKIHTLKTYSKDGKLTSSDEFRALDSNVRKNEYKHYYMDFFGDYIMMKFERDGYFINSPTFEKTDDGYRAISFSYTGMADTTMTEPANRHYYTVGIDSSLGQIAVIDTEKHEPSFIRFDMGKDKTVSSEKIYCNEDGKLLFVTTDTDGNEQLWAVNDSLEEIVLNGKSGRITVTADSLDELKQYVDDGTLGQSGEDFYDYFYSFFVEGWKFPEVNEVKFSDISFSFTYPFNNLAGINTSFTVADSPLEELKPGNYSIKVAEGMMDFYITGLNEEKTEKTIEMLRKYEEVHKLLLFFNSCRLWNTPAYGKGVTYPGAMDFVYVYYGEKGTWNKLDEESLYRYLKEDFGVTEPEKLTVQGTLLGDGQYNSLYELYPQEQRSVLDVKETSDGIEVTVRFYADTEMLIRSHLIVYYFDKDSRFNGYTVLEKGKYDPAGIHYLPDEEEITNE